MVAVENIYYVPVMLVVAAIINAILTFLFVKNEVELSEEQFENILTQQKERFPKRNFGKTTIKFM
jgi:hypothetical protein